MLPTCGPLASQIRSFEFDKQKGGFKAWLRTLVNRRVVDWLRKHREEQAVSQQFAELPDREPQPDELWAQHWKEQHLAFCLEQVRVSVTAQTYEAFELLMQDLSVEDVCAQLGLVPKQVYRAKSRVLQLVRAKMTTMVAEVGE